MSVKTFKRNSITGWASKCLFWKSHQPQKLFNFFFLRCFAYWFSFFPPLNLFNQVLILIFETKTFKILWKRRDLIVASCCHLLSLSCHELPRTFMKGFCHVSAVLIYHPPSVYPIIPYPYLTEHTFGLWSTAEFISIRKTKTKTDFKVWSCRL